MQKEEIKFKKIILIQKPMRATFLIKGPIFKKIPGGKMLKIKKIFLQHNSSINLLHSKTSKLKKKFGAFLVLFRFSKKCPFLTFLRGWYSFKAGIFSGVFLSGF